MQLRSIRPNVEVHAILKSINHPQSLEHERYRPLRMRVELDFASVFENPAAFSPRRKNRAQEGSALPFVARGFGPAPFGKRLVKTVSAISIQLDFFCGQSVPFGTGFEMPDPILDRDELRPPPLAHWKKRFDQFHAVLIVTGRFCFAPELECLMEAASPAGVETKGFSFHPVPFWPGFPIPLPFAYRGKFLPNWASRRKNRFIKPKPDAVVAACSVRTPMRKSRAERLKFGVVPSVGTVFVPSFRLGSGIFLPIFQGDEGLPGVAG